MYTLHRRIMPYVLLAGFIISCDSNITSQNTQNAQSLQHSDAETQLVVPVNASAGQALQVDLQWKTLHEAQEYSVQLSESESFETTIVDTVVSSTLFTTPLLSADRTYFWKVLPLTAQQPASWSDIWSFKTGSHNKPPVSGSFVQVQGSDFVVNGEVLRFAGTNAYYLPNYEKINTGVVDRALNLFEETGINVIRMWGFYDGYDCGYSKHDASENVIQTAPGVYSESALRDLDKVIAKGKERGIKFIIPFINFWDELGGICQYNTWAGASNPSRNTQFFITNPQTQQWFKDYIYMLLNRVNTVTGVAYKDEPAIFAWQIMNEGRNRGQDAHILRDWYQEMAQYIKSIDPNHLVSTGEEGFDEGTPTEYTLSAYSNTYALRANEGTSYVLNTAIPEIDFGNAHWYPDEFGFGTTINENLLTAQTAWLEDHQRIAASHGKPFVVGEFGFPGWADGRVKEVYDHFYEQAEAMQIDGTLFWQLVADGAKCWEFGGNICYPGGRADTRLYEDFKQHVAAMNNGHHKLRASGN